MALASNAPTLGLCAKISTVVLYGDDVKRVEFAGIRSSILRYAEYSLIPATRAEGFSSGRQGLESESLKI